jgi:hypothetical protein
MKVNIVHHVVLEKQKFHTKTNFVAIIVPKVLKPNNVLVNVVVVVTICSQVLKQQTLRQCEPMKAKVTTNWQTEEHMCDFFIHIIKELQGGDSGSQAPIDLNGPFHSN